MATQTATITRTDAQLQQDVMDELTWDQRLTPSAIGVSVKEGVVTLTGDVSSYWQRNAAQDAAHRMRGVLAVANEISVVLPGATERTDAELAHAAVHALTWDAGIAITQIDLTVSKGWITLQGEVPYGYQRYEAEQVVRRLAGVKGVVNLLTVIPHIVPKDLKQGIERALTRSAEAEAQGITVEVHGTTVTLKGTVHSLSERDAVVRVAWSALGVTAVETRLVIVP